MLPSLNLKNEEAFSEVEKGNELFPVFVKLNQLRTLLIGAGNVGIEKLTAIVNNSKQAKVTVLAEEVSKDMHQLVNKHPNLVLVQKRYEAADLQDVDLVFVATNNDALNQLIRRDAHQRGLLVNFADQPDLCDFYLGSIVQKGELKIAISTNGKSPTMAKRLKEILNDAIPAEIDQSIDNLHMIRNNLGGNFKQKVAALNHLTASFVKHEDAQWPVKKIAIYAIAVLSLMIFGHIFFSLIPYQSLSAWGNGVIAQLDATIIYFMIGGFLAQLVDGALGMAYGVSATTFLLSFGVSPAAASASVHASEIFTSGVSGLMHLRFGNVRTKLFKKLLLPGILGAIAGAYILSSLENYGYIIKPIVSAYTLFLGVKILLKAVAKARESKPLKRVGPLAFIGAFLDSIGGGGWGPIVTSTLISRGGHPRYTIGSVNLTEFFVTMASSLTFITMIGLTHWQIIAGLIIGGCIAAPFGAFITKRLNVKSIMILVGLIVIITSLRTIYVLLTKL